MGRRHALCYIMLLLSAGLSACGRAEVKDHHTKQSGQAAPPGLYGDGRHWQRWQWLIDYEVIDGTIAGGPSPEHRESFVEGV